MPIIACTDELMPDAESLVKSVFPSMTLLERLSFIAIRRPESLAGRLLMWFAGVKSKVAFSVYIDEAGAVLGTTGLYQYKRDAQEAVWVGWFCVDPKARGKGIGQKLIEHTICLAVQAGFRRVRLYTSTDPNEEAAQRLYEKNGFKEISRKNGLFTTKIFREKEIKQGEYAPTADQRHSIT
jgi:GNAT superfamily N-acetyltransferase